MDFSTVKCRKCHKETPEGTYCIHCGVKQTVSRAPRRRGNGEGTVYKRENGTWVAVYIVGYSTDENGKLHKCTRSKSGFKTKKEALAYLPRLKAAERPTPAAVTLQALYDAWEPTHRAGKSTMDCYHAAWKYFAPIRMLKVADITIDDLQECVDDCPKGKRTKENMKALAGLLYKYAIPRHIATLNMGQFLMITAENQMEKDAIPAEALKKLEAGVGKVKYADYVVAHCYLGFRPTELIELDVKDYDRGEKAFVGGSKTNAGRNRTVTVSPKIQPIIDRLTRDKISGPVFCGEDGSSLTIREYREIFYSVLAACGIDNPTREVSGMNYHKYTPHSCRHTFATLMKRVDGTDKDKLELMGHTSTAMLRHYQSVEFDDLRKITNAM